MLGRRSLFGLFFSALFAPFLPKPKPRQPGVIWVLNNEAFRRLLLLKFASESPAQNLGTPVPDQFIPLLEDPSPIHGRPIRVSIENGRFRLVGEQAELPSKGGSHE